MHQNTCIKTDVIIVGGSFAGLTLGLGLAQAGLSVTVLDKQDPSLSAQARFDGRVSSLTIASTLMLERLGVLSHLADTIQPINDILVTDGRLGKPSAPFFLHFDRQETDAGPLGYIVENLYLRRALNQTVQTTRGLNILAPVTAREFENTGPSFQVRLEDGRILAAPLCIAADGRNSVLRNWAGLKTVGWDYDQSGLIATVEHEHSHEGIAHEYFLPSGPFAILPMTGNRSSLVWTEKKALGQALLKLDKEQFMQECTRRFGTFLGKMKLSGSCQAYPLSLWLAYEYIAPRIALVGDAAHGIHPLAGQGLNLGLKDAAALVDIVTDAYRLGLDIGAHTQLERYQRWRRFDSVSLAATCDVLNRLFSNNAEPVRLMRGIGLGIVNTIAPLRRFFVNHASGMTGNIPKLMRKKPVR